MFDWPLLFRTALLSGLVLSVTLTVLAVLSASVAADMWVGDYPPDIRQKYGPMSPRAARLRPLVAASFLVAVLVVILLGLVAVRARTNDVPFLPALTFSAVALLVFNTLDLLILDWLLFCTIQPRQMILPGTEGMAGYRDYRFHFIGFLKGLAFCGVGGLLTAGVWMVVQRLAG
ncbi:MAG TPA: hypothetical protein VLD63_05915 [Anaerolineales bacterium]|nr:hypothetical protein [Anaerolineales bacterium]